MKAKAQTKVAAIVPARSGSKGFPGKNIAEINGKTLIEYAIESGVSSTAVDKVFISTDSKQYEDIAQRAGAASLGLRPEDLASDSAKTVDVILEMLTHDQMSDFTHVVLLQPTSPIRPKGLIDEAVSLSLSFSESVVTVAKVEDPHPYKMKRIVDGVLEPFLPDGISEIPRQKLPIAYELTGAIYVTPVLSLAEKRSFFSENTIPLVCEDFVNIDSEKDFLFLEFLVKNGKVEV